VWLLHQFFARRRLARVARGSLLLARAQNRIVCRAAAPRPAAPASAVPLAAPPSAPVVLVAPPDAPLVAPLPSTPPPASPLAAPSAAPPAAPAFALGTPPRSPRWGDEAVGYAASRTDRARVARVTAAASRGRAADAIKSGRAARVVSRRAARVTDLIALSARASLLTLGGLKREFAATGFAADSDVRSSSSSRSVAACRRRVLPSLTHRVTPRTIYPLFREYSLHQSESRFAAHAATSSRCRGPAAPASSPPAAPAFPPPPLLRSNSVT
jgi:hypothetical protein